MAQETEYRLETLETVLAEFIMQTNRSLSRMERDTEAFKETMQRRDEEYRLAQQRRDEEYKTRNEEYNSAQQRRDEEWAKEKKLINREWNQKWGEMADKMGTFAEDLAAPNLRRIAREQFDCKSVDFFAPRIDKKNPLDPSQVFEFDALLVSGQTVFLLEAKFSVRMVYLERMPTLIENFKLAFPEYTHYTVNTIFASMSIRDDQVKYLTSLGIYAMALGEENMELLNFDELQARPV